MKNLFAIAAVLLSFGAAAQQRNFDAKWNRNTPRTPDQYVETMYYDMARHQLK